MKIGFNKKYLLLSFIFLNLVGCGIGNRVAERPTGSLNPPNGVSDLPFIVDCSALGTSRQSDCDAFIAATRDEVYPLLRSITGISLSSCYNQIHYTILPEGSLDGGIGGFTDRNHITYVTTYSIDLPHKYDVHELLHSISTCSGALDDHLFHGMMQNYAYDKLGVHDLGYFTPQSFFISDLNRIKEAVTTASGQTLIDDCKGILSGELMLAYFNLSELALQRLYRSTFVSHSHSEPPDELRSVWGDASSQVQVLVETLEQENGAPLNIPACGY